VTTPRVPSDPSPVVIVALADYESLKETAYLLRSPENARRLLASIDRLEHGGGIERDLHITQHQQLAPHATAKLGLQPIGNHGNSVACRADASTNHLAERAAGKRRKTGQRVLDVESRLLG